jgi:hypothetical protein
LEELLYNAFCPGLVDRKCFGSGADVTRVNNSLENLDRKIEVSFTPVPTLLVIVRSYVFTSKSLTWD